MKLTQEEKRIKIAEACGWKQRRIGSEIHVASPDGEEVGWRFNAEKDCVVHMFPDYFTDLNAMREAESILKGTQIAEYESQLKRVHFKSDKDEWWFPQATIESAWWCVTAAQRAEALGLTLGLWEEGQ